MEAIDLAESISVGEAIIEEAKSQVNERLSRKYAGSLLRDEPTYEKTSEAMRHGIFLGGGGKRIRSAMVLATASAFGEQTEESFRCACSVEEIHCYTLILDDFQDKDDLRRGEVATHVKFGVNTAILAASRLYERGLEAVHQQSPKIVKLARRLLDDLHRGQTADLESEGLDPKGRTHLLDFIQYGKTSALFELSLVLGAITSGAEVREKDLGALLDFGYHFGRAFQTRDDVLSQTATREQLGKPAGAGADEGKLTAVAVFGSVEAAQNEAIANCNKGIKAIQDIKANVSALEHLIRYATYRSL